ncbi:MAG: hypothetical protein ACRBC3_02460 [Burkholderiaceae bacterium]
MDVWSDLEELDFQQTVLGDLLLRRRRDPALPGIELFEVKLGDDFLMSSQFHASEVALATLGLDRLAQLRPAGQQWQVVVGGLGLGHTAKAALDDDRVSELLVVEYLEPIIGWHQRGLVPLGETLCADSRCRFIHSDFFAAAAGGDGFDPQTPQRLFDAILLDIDHAPDNWLGDTSQAFYSAAGLQAMSEHLTDQGVFALWSNDPPDASFEVPLSAVFEQCEAHRVGFENPYTGQESACTVYVGHRVKSSGVDRPSRVDQ